MPDNIIIYEQPLNELIRVCLRLEQIFSQIDYQVNDTSTLGTRNLVASIINLLNVLDRPDFKAKLAKELGHHMTVLTRLENTPKIDEKKLHQLLQQLDELTRAFINSSGKIGQNLREIELLNNLRLQLSTPGGGCSFDIPVYHYWLQLPSEQRQTMINSWLAEFNNIRLATKLTLQLIREGARSQSKVAEKGFYQELLDPHVNLRLIRVAIQKDAPAYPEISVSRHFVGVRFSIPSIQERPTQYLENIPFWLSYCIS
jgi:cell division protein ZapD